MYITKVMKVALGFVLCFTVLIGAGCSRDQRTPVQIGDELQILHLGNGDEPADIDPHITVGMPERRIQIALFEGLVTKSAETLEPMPGVAESWDVSDDGLTYTFYFNPNARWSNGDPITPEDFIWSWRRTLAPELGNQYAHSLYYITNAEAYHRGEIDDFSKVGVEVLDERTLRITLNAPIPYFLELLDHHSLYPVHPPTVERFGGRTVRGTAWTRPENFVGNGAFTLKRWEPHRVLVVERNPYYWGADDVRLQEIHFHPVQEGTTEDRMYRAGQLHIAGLSVNLPVERVLAKQEQQHPELETYDAFITYYYEFNTRKPPLDDVRVRQALTYAINREQITERVVRVGDQPAYHLTPPNTAGYTSRARVKQDEELARQLLAEAGFPNGEGFPRLTILYNTMEHHQRIAVVIQQMWKQVLNIDVNITNQEWRVYLANKRTGDFEIGRAGWIGDYYDPNTFLGTMVSDSGNNYTGWGNAEYDALIAEAARTGDREVRHELFQRAEAILMEEVPLAPIYFYVRNNFISPSVRGWHNNIMEHVDYRPVYLEPQGNR